MHQPLRWGILSTGSIARAFAVDLKSSRSGALAAVASRTQANADAFVRQSGAGDPRPLYAIEADHVAECIGRALTQSPAMSWDDTLGNMRTLDLWRKEAGMRHPGEP